MRPPIFLALLLTAASAFAQGHGQAVIFALLLWVGLFGGIAAGALEALNPWRKLGPGWWFVIYLSLLALCASVAASSLEAIPYALGYGAFFGVVPFMLLFFLSRYMANTIRSYRSSRDPSVPNK
jgi:peptidoglycan/LPS O-acetylase OafA/YrhL